MVSPWLPKIRPESARLAVRGIRWPSIEAGIDWLQEQDFVSDLNLVDMFGAADSRSASLAGETIAAFNRKLRDELTESISKGEGRKEWAKRAANIGDWTKSMEENIHRTYSHRAYHEGQQRAIDEFPGVSEQFPYVEYYATHDTRTRETHRALDGKVAHKDSALAQEMAERLSEWGCRCSRVFLTIEDAQAKGIDQDIPQSPAGAATVPFRPKQQPPPIAAAPPAVQAPGASRVTKAPPPVQEFGPSAAKVVLYTDETETRAKIAKTFGRDILDDVPSLVGADDTARVAVETEYKVSTGKTNIRVNVQGPGYKANRWIGQDASGRSYIKNEYFEVEETGKGTGIRVFAKQVENASKANFSKIVTTAAGSKTDDNFNGYYTWARFGYDAPLPAAEQAKLPDFLRGSKTVQDIMVTPEGRKWWYDKGGEIDMEFDLSEGSRSRQVLAAYVEEQRAKGKI